MSEMVEGLPEDADDLQIFEAWLKLYQQEVGDNVDHVASDENDEEPIVSITRPEETARKDAG